MTTMDELNRARKLLSSRKLDDKDLSISIIERLAIDYGHQYCHCNTIKQWHQLADRIELSIIWEYST